MRRSVRLAIAAAVVWWVFAFRFVTPGFLNDDFDHLSKARQLLHGEWPDRDFYDDGRPLTILASAAAQRIDPTLLSELVLRAGAIAIGSAFVFLLALELARSTFLALLAVIFATALWPRLYNYPKILLFPLMLWLLWRYVDDPDARRPIALALLTIVAGLFRYDYGLYLAVIIGLTLVVRHAREARRPLVTYAAIVLAGVSPYLGWLAFQNRLMTTGAGGAAALVDKLPGVPLVPVHLDLSRGLYHIGPEPPRISVRWREGVDREAQAGIEQRFGLHVGDRKSDGRSVLYRMDDPSPSRILALVADPRVEDTGGVDRGNGALLPLYGWNWWAVHVPLLRLEASTIFHSSEDAQGWIYYLFLLTPFIAALVYWRWPDRVAHQAGPKMFSLVLCGVIVQQVFVLGQPGPRLPDIAGIMSVLLVWTGRRLVEVSRSRDNRVGLRTLTVAALSLALIVITSRAVSAYSRHDFFEVAAAGLVRPSALAGQARELHRRPLDYWLAEKRVRGRIEGVPALTQYLATCLAPEDRPLLVAYAPEVYFLSEHLFPGGINKFDPSGFNPTSAQILRWLRGQAVPLVLVEERDRTTLDQEFVDLGAYVRARYRPVQTTTFDGDRPFQILADTSREPLGVDPRWGLPCFADTHPAK